MTQATQWEQAPKETGQWCRFSGEPPIEYSGQITALDLFKGARTYDGDDCGYVDLRQEDGTSIRLGLDRKMIADQVSALDPAVGDQLRVVFTGWKTGQKSGRDYKDFEVAIMRAAAQTGQEATAPQADSGQPVTEQEPPPPAADDLPF